MKTQPITELFVIKEIRDYGELYLHNFNSRTGEYAFKKEFTGCKTFKTYEEAKSEIQNINVTGCFVIGKFFAKTEKKEEESRMSTLQKITVDVQKKILSERERVKIISGGRGAFGADGYKGVVLTKDEVKELTLNYKDNRSETRSNYNGVDVPSAEKFILFSTPIYIEELATHIHEIWGLGEGFELQEIK